MDDLTFLKKFHLEKEHIDLIKKAKEKMNNNLKK